jgi:hypothetical protein
VAKQSGLGDNLYVDGYDLSGDIGSLGRIGGGPAVSDVTGIVKSGFERIGLRLDGSMEYAAWWNPSASQSHDVLSALPTADRIVSYLRGTTLGSPAASMLAKDIDYAGTRGADGSLSHAVSSQSNATGIEWGVNLTAGKDTDTAATNGATVDLGALPISYDFGWSAYLHVFAFTGTSVTVKIQDSADGSSWLDLSGASFTAATAIGGQRIQSSSATATVRRYVRAVTSGTFTNAVFAVNFVRYEIGGHA